MNPHDSAPRGAFLSPKRTLLPHSSGSPTYSTGVVRFFCPSATPSRMGRLDRSVHRSSSKDFFHLQVQPVCPADAKCQTKPQQKHHGHSWLKRPARSLSLASLTSVKTVLFQGGFLLGLFLPAISAVRPIWDPQATLAQRVMALHDVARGMPWLAYHDPAAK